MQVYKLTLVAAILLSGCTRSPHMTIRQRLERGDKLHWVPGECPKPATAQIDNTSYFAVEKNKFVAVRLGSCKSKMHFETKWLNDSRVMVSQPRSESDCSKPNLDDFAKLIFDFSEAGKDLKFYSSSRPGCSWLRWANG